VLEHVLGRVELLDAARSHDDQPVTERQRLALVVGDEDGGEPEPLVELVQLGPDLVAQAGVEVAQRFVEEDEVGPGDQAPRQRHALLLAAAELTGEPVEQVSAVDELGRLLDPPLGRLLALPLPPPRAQRVADVLPDAHVRPERVGLEDHPDVAPVGREVHPCAGVEHRPVTERDATRVRRLQARKAAQRGRLPAAARAEEDEELALLDLEVEIVHGRRRRVALELLPQTFGLHVGHWPSSLFDLGAGASNGTARSTSAGTRPRTRG
jgi:hypothetical protein